MLRNFLRLAIATGTLAASFALSGQAVASSSTLVGMVWQGDIYVKSGTTTAPWTRLTSTGTASQLAMYGDRVAFVDANKDLYLKQGLTGQWHNEIGNVHSFALTETGLLVRQTDGKVYYKAGQDPASPWDSNVMATNGSEVYLSPSQMVMIDSNGDLLGKGLSQQRRTSSGWGPESQWVTVAHQAQQAALSDNLFAYVSNQHQTFAKLGGIADAWFGQDANGAPGQIDNRAIEVWVMGDMYCAGISDSGTPGAITCKPQGALGIASTQVFGHGTSLNGFAVGSNLFVSKASLDSNGSKAYGLDYSAVTLTPSGWTFAAQNWNVLGDDNATEVATNQQ